MKRFAELSAVPWANGAGETTEIVSYSESQDLTPASAPWRLSVARLDRPAPFSRMLGTQRSLMPVAADLVLRVGGRDRSITAGSVVRFDGDAEVTLIRLSSAGFAINLIVRPGGEGKAPRLCLDDHVGDGVAALALDATDDLQVFDLITPYGRGADLAMPQRSAVVHLPFDLPR